MKLFAGCKINIYLNVLFRRADGYHELESLFLPLKSPADILHVRPAPGRGFTLSCSDPALSGTENILYTAYDLFSRETGFQPELTLHLEKKIPAGAGLGGGSSDAAVLLGYLNSLLEEPLPLESLARLALQIGADVPFFLYNQPALVQGIGESVKQVSIQMEELDLLLVCPEVSVSTKEAYERWQAHPSSLPSLTSSRAADNGSFCISDVVLFNSLEPAVFALYPLLRELKIDLLEQGAAGCVMSGSGSSLCAFFRGRDGVESAGSWLDERAIPYFHHQF
ncbi:MAG: 4-(cytidine 5'-diphospho)-2-C-methyl-D-erythritol kinase [Desulfovibrionales bacterium]